MSDRKPFSDPFAYLFREPTDDERVTIPPRWLRWMNEPLSERKPKPKRKPHA